MQIFLPVTTGSSSNKFLESLSSSALDYDSSLSALSLASDCIISEFLWPDKGTFSLI